MPYIKVEIIIYKSLGYSAHKDQIIVGNHYGGNTIKKESVIELFKRMVNVFRYYNRVVRKGIQ